MWNTSGCVNNSIKVPHLRPRLFKIKLHRFKRCFDGARMSRPDNIKAAQMKLHCCPATCKAA